MPSSREQKLDQRHRLLAMRDYLSVRSLPEDKEFEVEVVAACVRKVQPVIESLAHSTGERIIAAIAKDVGIRFEEVKTLADIDTLEQKYLVEKREIGFGLLAQELADPTVDALLFQRMNVDPTSSDRWIAVLNLQQTQARAYWSRPHEIVHRLAEPPQRRLPFFRHRSDSENRLERIIDKGAAELAFPKSVFGRRVQRLRGLQLNWDLVELAREQFAPTSSVMASSKAFIAQWAQPAFLLSAGVRGRRQSNTDVALRVSVEGFSPTAKTTDVRFFPNMRVPSTSPISHASETGQSITDFESLKRWTTSTGESLPDCRVLTSAIRRGSVVYALMSVM
jgi:hypothetical protein